MRNVYFSLWLVGFALTVFVTSKTLDISSNAPTTTGWVGHTQEVYRELQSTLISVMDVETGQRGYVITGNKSYLESYEEAKIRTDAHILRLTFLTRDNPTQQHRVEILQKEIGREYQALGDTLESLRLYGKEAAIKKVNSHVGLDTMRRARAIVHQMQLEENRLLIRRDTDARRGYVFLVIALLVVIVRDVVVFTIAWRKYV